MFFVSLALTLVELTAVCVYSEEGIDEYGQINFRLKRGAHSSKRTVTVGETHQPHYGFGF